MFNNLKKFIFFLCLFLVGVFLFSSPVFAAYSHLKIEYWDGIGWVEESSLPTNIDVTQSISFDIKVTARHEDDSPLISGQGAFASITVSCDNSFSSPSFPLTDNLINGQKIINVTFNLGSVPVGSSLVNCHFEVEDSNDPVGYGHGHLYVELHRFVDRFDVTLDAPGAKVAGAPFNITVTAWDSEGNIATTFNDDVVLTCALGDMDSTLIQGSNFVNGVAGGFTVTLYGSDPVIRLNTIYASNTVMYPGQGDYPNGNTGSFTVNPAAFNKVLLLFPGETLVPATKAGTGKTGTPNAQTAGVNFIGVKAIATDSYWNPVNAGPYPVITFSSSDTHALTFLPPPFNMAGHTATFNNINLKTAGDQWVRVKENIRNSTSTSYPVQINGGSYNRFEFDPITAQYTTTPFVVTVTAYDQYDNIVTSYNKINVPLKSTTDLIDPDGATVTPNTLDFFGGIASRSISVTRAGGPGSHLTVTDPDDATFVDSNNFQIFHGAFTTLLVLFNGEDQHSGIAPGRTGVPVDYVVAGDTVTLTVIATDDLWNTISDGSAGLPITISSDTGYIKSLDDGKILPVVGFDTYNVVFLTTAENIYPYAAEAQKVTAATGPVPDIRGNSNYITVHPQPTPYKKLVLIAPGENLDPGTPTEPDGKTGLPSSLQATDPFDLKVVTVDKYWNPVETGPYPTVLFTSSDGSLNVNLPVGNQVIGSAVEKFPGNCLDTLGWQWIKIEDVGDGTKFDIVVVEVVHGPLDNFYFSNVASLQKIGVSFNLQIIARDGAGKKVASYNNAINLNCNTGAGTYTPANITFSGGEWSGVVTINQAGSGVQLSCSDSGASGQSNFFTVEAGDYSNLLVILPDETQTPGVAPGKSGVVAVRNAGDSVFATVLAVDDQWNTVATVAPTINLSTTGHSEIPINNIALSNGQGIFEIKFRSAGVQIVTVQDVNQVVITSTSTITINPGNYSKLQIIVPGEAPDPGGWEVDGKTGDPINQRTGVGFPVQVLAVDDYWNQVVSINGGQVHLSSSDGSLVSPEQDFAYVGGICNMQVFLGNSGLIGVTANDLGYLGKTSQTVNIVLDKGYIYEVVTPAGAVSGQAGVGPYFNTTVRLVDPDFPGVPIAGESPTVTLIPFLANHDPAGGNLGITTATLTNGEIIIGNQSYDIAEDICIKVVDSCAREKFSGPIHMVASALEYKVIVPAQATVGPPNYFSITVELRDTITGNLVPAATDREIDLVIYSTASGIPGTGVTGVSKVTITKGESHATIQESYTKAEDVYIIVSDVDLVVGTSNTFTMAPDEYKRLQIVSSGETVEPGIPSQTGKIGVPNSWQAGISFPVTVRAVDQYWNLSDFSEGKIHLVSSDGSLTDVNPSNQDASFVSGMISFIITIHTPGDIKVTASDLDNPLKTPQSVDIPVSFAVYNIVTPANASTSGNFTMLINLVDGNSGALIIADHTFTLTPLKANRQPAEGILGVTDSAVVSGQVTIAGQNYNLVEDICIKLVDDYGRVSYSDVIHMQSSTLQYEVIVPTHVPVGPPESFELIINLRDASTGNLVTSMDHQVRINAYELMGMPATGSLAVSTALLAGGTAVIAQSYDKIESIYIKVWDPVAVVNDGISSNILVVAGKEVDISLTVAGFLEAGQTTPVIVTLKDAHGNIASDIQVNFKIRGQGSLDVEYDFTDSLGEATCMLTCDQYAQDGTILLEAYTVNINKASNVEVYGVPVTTLKMRGVHTEVEDFIYAKPETSFAFTAESRIGIDTIYYQIDGAIWQVYTEEFSISEVGIHTICYYAVDVNSHSEAVKTSKKIQISKSTAFLEEGKAINYPNPFRAGKEPTFIEYNLDAPSSVTVIIYDLLGQVVWKKSFSEGENGGSLINNVVWWGRNGLSEVVSNGGYICRIYIQKEKRAIIRKIAVVK